MIEVRDISTGRIIARFRTLVRAMEYAAARNQRVGQEQFAAVAC